MHALLRTSLILALALAAQSAPAAPPASAPSPADLQKSFPAIRRLLANSDFSQRDAGQKLLDALPPSQLDTLRTLAKNESDPEVKAHLDDRINTLELFLLTHPAPISLHVQDLTLSQVCAELTKQLGNDTQIAVSGTARTTYSLQADNLPFWEIVNQLNRQSPITITSTTTTTTAGIRNLIRLSPATGTAPDYRLVDTFFVKSQISGTPATGNWALLLTFNADPRVRITRYASQLRIVKITDQDGASLFPSIVTSSTGMSTLSRPVSSWSSSVTLAAAPGVRNIKDLRAVVDLTLLEKERTVTVDLAQPAAPVETSRGTISVDQNAAGNITVRFANPPAAPAGTPVSTVYTSIRILDQDGKTLSTSLTAGSQVTIGLNAANAVPAKVELSWPESSRPMTLPLELHDIPLPAPANIVKPANPPPTPLPAARPPILLD